MFVGTGCSGPMAARMAILKAVRQLAREAKVYVHIRKFQVINQARLRNLNTHVITRGPQSTSLVCAGRRRVHRCQARLRRLRLDALGDVALRSRQLCRCVRACVRAQTTAGHAGRSHCAPRIAAGLAWRPGGESICCGAPSARHVHAHPVRLTPRARAQKSIVPAKQICLARRASATCSAPSRAWSRSCCATATDPRSAT